MTMPPNTSNPPPSTEPPPSYDSQTTTTPPTAPPPRYTPNRWAPYATEAEYLTALRAWAEEKTFVRLDERTALEGFYGKMTMREYAEREGGGWRADGGRRRREEGEKGKEKGKEKRGWFRRRGNKSKDGGV